MVSAECHLCLRKLLCAAVESKQLVSAYFRHKEQWTKDETLHWCPTVWCERGQKTVSSRSTAPYSPSPTQWQWKETAKQAMGQLPSLLVQNFFTNYCDLDHPKMPRAQGQVSVKICLQQSSKLYINSLREQNSVSFLSPELNKSYPTSDIKRYWEAPTSARDTAPDCTVQSHCHP